MRKGIYIIFAAVVLICLFAVSSAKAQSGLETGLNANIPFEFSVGNVTLPAGEYTVKSITRQTDAALQIKSVDGHYRALVMMGSVIGKVQDSGRLIFSRYGNHYFFAQAWMPGTKTGLEASKSRAERAIERELATTGPRIEEVALTVRR